MTRPGARVSAAGRTTGRGPGAVRVPNPEHMLLLRASNASRERFQSFTVKSLIDAMTILGRFGEPLDWAAIEDLARRGRMLRPLGVFFALLGRLGVEDLVEIQSRLDIPVLWPGRRPAHLRRNGWPAPLQLTPSLLRFSHLRIA